MSDIIRLYKYYETNEFCAMNTFTLPDINTNPDIRVSYTINNQSYMFHFQWCDSFCLLDIYMIQDNENVYIAKGEPLVPGRNLTARADMQGSLMLVNKYGQNAELLQENFSSDFVLVYIAENELDG